MSEERIQAGKHWVGQLFEQIIKEYQDKSKINRWNWKDDWPAYFICLQVDGKDDLYFIPSQNRGFTRAQIEDCGNPDPANDPVRRDVETTIRWKFESLIK